MTNAAKILVEECTKSTKTLTKEHNQTNEKH
jgi:hypothetical protein